MFPVLIPPAYGLKGVGFETYTGDGPIPTGTATSACRRWEARATSAIPASASSSPSSRISSRRNSRPCSNISSVSGAPAPPPGSFNPAAARRGEILFTGKADCARCHTPPTYTDVLSGPDPRVPLLHDPEETGAEPIYATRSATGQYRATPLRGAWQHPPYFHDGSAATLLAVVDHYDDVLRLNLSAREKADLVEFLKSL